MIPIIITIMGGLIFVMLVTWFSTWVVWGFTPLDFFIGYKVRKTCNIITQYHILPTFSLSPKTIFWLSGTEKQYALLAKRMSEERRILDINDKGIFEKHVEAVKAKLYEGKLVWPSKEVAEFCGDPNGWYPTKDDIK